MPSSSRFDAFVIRRHHVIYRHQYATGGAFLLLQVSSGVTLKKAFASMVFTLGRTPEKLVLNGRNGKDFFTLGPAPAATDYPGEQIGAVHLACLVLPFVYLAGREKSLADSVAVLEGRRGWDNVYLAIR